MKRSFICGLAIAALLACAKDPEVIAAVSQVEGLEVRINEKNCLGSSVRVAEAGSSVQALYIIGSNLYVGADRKVQVYDVSNPMSPRLRSECPIDGTARQITADERAIYVTTRGDGVFIIDASNLDAIKLITRYDSIELATGIDVAGNVMFVSLRSYGVEFVDITDLTHPRHIYIEKTPESQSVWYNDGYLYSGEWAKGKINTISVSDMSSISTASSVNLQGYGDGVSVLGNRLFASTGHNSRNESETGKTNDGLGHGVEIFDISDPADPTFISRCQFDTHYRGGGGDWWTVRPSSDGKTIFCVDTDNGLYVVDITKEKNPKIIGRVYAPNPAKPGQSLGYMTSVAVGNGVVYASGDKIGCIAFECKKAKQVTREKGANPTNESSRFAYKTPSTSRFKAWLPDDRYQVKSAAVAGKYLIAACSDAGLYVLDENLRTVGRGAVRFAGDVAVRGEKVFVAEGLDGLGIYRLGKDGSLTEISRFKDFGYYRLAMWVWAPADDWVVVNDRAIGNVLIHIEADGSFKVCGKQNGGTTWWDKYLSAEASAEGYILNTTVRKGITWMKLSDSGAKIGGLESSFSPNGNPVLFKNNTFLIADKVSARPVTIKPGSSPVEVLEKGSKKTFGQINWDGGSKLATNNRASKKVMLFDISAFPEMKLIWNESFLGNPETPVFWNGKVVIPCAYQGLLIEK